MSHEIDLTTFEVFGDQSLECDQQKMDSLNPSPDPAQGSRQIDVDAQFLARGRQGTGLLPHKCSFFDSPAQRIGHSAASSSGVGALTRHELSWNMSMMITHPLANNRTARIFILWLVVCLDGGRANSCQAANGSDKMKTPMSPPGRGCY